MKKKEQKIKGGYYIKARKIQNSRIMRQPPHVREIWDYLLMNANHKDVNYNGLTIKRGQLFRTYKEIREGLAWYVGWRKMMYNENQTKKAMKALRELRMIATKKALGGVLITICNYDVYQNPKNYESTTEGTIESTTKAPRKHHPIPDNNKNDKKTKRKKEDSILPENKFSDDVRDLVNFFVSTLPKKLWPTNGKRELWLDALDKCMRIDGYSKDQIKEIIDTFRRDSFWSTNFLSPAKLRQRNKEGVKYIDYFWLKLQNHPVEGKTREEIELIKRNREAVKKQGVDPDNIPELRL